MRGTGWIAAALALACCQGAAAQQDPGDNTFGNLFRRGPTTYPQDTRPKIDVDCPIVQVADGQASFRAYSGADRSAAGVKYQYTFGELARECVATPDGRLELRIGISGYVLAGPSGAAGTFNVPVKVVIKRDSDHSIAATKVMRVATAIPPGESQSAFSAVTETIVIPFLRPEADEDYSIYVGFDSAGPEKPVKKQKRKRRG